MAEGPGRIAVLDVGKTNVKLCVADHAGRVLETASVANPVRPGPPWRSHDLGALGEWALATLATLARRHPIGHVIPTGHGSGGVLVGDDPDGPDGGAALPMIDYEDASPPDLDAAYARLAGGFLDRGSAIMHGSTHAARQILRMETERPDAFADARRYLNVAQYWAWRLSGVAVSEISALGAQTHLWNVAEARWSPIVAARGWARLMPPIVPAWTALGPIRPALAARFGLPEGIVVHAGGHDSSVAHHRLRAAGLADATLASTGTWIVAMAEGVDPAALDPARGMTLNASVLGAPVGGALAMGGREFSHVAGPDWRGARAGPEHVVALVARGTMALPAFGEDDGQHPGSAGRGRIDGPPPASPDERRALAVLYAALLTAACVDALGPSRRAILEGAFLAEPLFAPLVAALRPGAATETSDEPAGVAAGAALLVSHPTRRAPVAAALTPAAPLAIPGLHAYAARWTARAAAPFASETLP